MGMIASHCLAKELPNPLQQRRNRMGLKGVAEIEPIENTTRS